MFIYELDGIRVTAFWTIDVASVEAIIMCSGDHTSVGSIVEIHKLSFVSLDH